MSDHADKIREAVAQRAAEITHEFWEDAKRRELGGVVSSIANALAASELALAAVEQERDEAREGWDVFAARMHGAEREVVRLKAQLAELRDRAELAVFGCLPVLPISGASREGYRVNEYIEAEVRALPEEWAEAAFMICALHDALASVSGAEGTTESVARGGRSSVGSAPAPALGDVSGADAPVQLCQRDGFCVLPANHSGECRSVRVYPPEPASGADATEVKVVVKPPSGHHG